MGIGPIDTPLTKQAFTKQLAAEQPRNTDPTAEAEAILGVGVRPIIRDDYEARLEAFAKSLEGGDAVFREQLMTEILNRDPDALRSWLDVDIIDNETDGGRISPVQRSIIGESLAGAYNAGHPALATQEIPASADGGLVSGQTIQQGPLDAVVLNYSDRGLGHDGFLENADRVRAFIDLMNSSQGPEAREFREAHARHLIDQFVLQGDVNPLRRQAAAAIAAELLTGDKVYPDHLAGAENYATASTVLRDLERRGQLAAFFEQLEGGSTLLGKEPNAGIAEVNNRDPNDIYIARDGVSALRNILSSNTGVERYNEGDVIFNVLPGNSQLQPVLRDKGQTFTDAAIAAHNRGVDFVINAQLYDAPLLPLGPADPNDVTPEGQTIQNGQVLEGRGASSPGTFYISQTVDAAGNARYAFGAGDPPAGSTAAFGGGKPIILNGQRYAGENVYRDGVPPGAPSSGEPGDLYRPYLEYRSSNGYRELAEKATGSGKVIVAHNSSDNTLAIIVQPDGATDGRSLDFIRDHLYERGFDNAIAFDGSDSATLLELGALPVMPGDRKDNSIETGIGVALPS